jgi:hypothetical protein
MIRYTNVSLTPESKGLLNVRLRVQYDGSQGYPVIASARVLSGRQVVPWIAAPPMLVERGYARGMPMTFPMRFVGADPAAPLGLTSDGVEIDLAQPGQPPFYRERIDYIRQWLRDFADVRPADLQRLLFSTTPLTADALRTAYDWDDAGAWLAVQTADGSRVLLAVQPGPALTVLRWVAFPPPGRVVTPVRGTGYTVPAGGFANVRTGQVVASAAEADLAWEALDAPHSQARPLNGANLALWRTPVMEPVAATRVFARGNMQLGTSRTWDEIRDLFDNCNEVPYRRDWCVDNIWGAAGIELRIVLRRDIRVAANWAQQLPATALNRFSRENNVPRMLNVYFFRTVEGARAWGAPDRNPGLSNQAGAVWVGDRCTDADPDCWRRDVITVAHEIGHFLNLVHLCDDTGQLPACVPGDEHYLMYGLGTGLDSRLFHDPEIFRARERAWPYRP